MEFVKGNKTGDEKGSSLIEVLISLFILMVLMIGILQMFSAAYLINRKSSTRTLQAYKCEQVAENIRMVRVQARNNSGNLPPSAMDSGLDFNTNGFIGTLPHSSYQTGWNYWGPSGANIMEEENPPYRIFFRIDQDPVSGNLSVTVTAVEANKLGDGEDPYNTVRNLRRVEYVTQMP